MRLSHFPLKESKKHVAYIKPESNIKTDYEVQLLAIQNSMFAIMYTSDKSISKYIWVNGEIILTNYRLIFFKCESKRIYLLNINFYM